MLKLSMYSITNSWYFSLCSHIFLPKKWRKSLYKPLNRITQTKVIYFQSHYFNRPSLDLVFVINFHQTKLIKIKIFMTSWKKNLWFWVTILVLKFHYIFKYRKMVPQICNFIFLYLIWLVKLWVEVKKTFATTYRG